jgi:hypothetical protein
MKIRLAIAAAALGLASAMQASAGIVPRVGLGNMQFMRVFDANGDVNHRELGRGI